MTTFTWKTSVGMVFEVEPDFEIDGWTGREMRAAEKLVGNLNDGGFYTTTAMVLAVSIARTVPGYTIEAADAELTFGRVREILTELNTRAEAEVPALVDAAIVDALPGEDGVVLSPTRPDEPDEAAPSG